MSRLKDLEEKAIARLKLFEPNPEFERPLADKKRYFEFEKYPKYKASYIRAFDKMLKSRDEHGLKRTWESAEEVFRWWMGEDPKQLTFADLGVSK